MSDNDEDNILRFVSGFEDKFFEYLACGIEETYCAVMSNDFDEILHALGLAKNEALGILENTLRQTKGIEQSFQVIGISIFQNEIDFVFFARYEDMDCLEITVHYNQAKNSHYQKVVFLPYRNIVVKVLSDGIVEIHDFITEDMTDESNLLARIINDVAFRNK